MGHRIRNREVTGSNPVEVLYFLQASLRNCINFVHCDDHFFNITEALPAASKATRGGTRLRLTKEVFQFTNKWNENRNMDEH